MNPNENNPISPAGVGGVQGGATPAPAPGMGSTDFTNPATLGMTGGATSADAADTDSAAANDSGVSPMMPPLTPAEPVPGSIGSVTSVPPLAPEPMDMGPLGNVAGATSSNMPVMGQAAEDKPAESSTTGGSPYYNPFMRNNVTAPAEPKPATPSPAPAEAGSTPVAQATKPQTDNFSDRLNATKTTKKKSGGTMTLLGWLLALLFLVTTVIFAILWQGEANKKPEVVYYPTTSEPEPSEDEGDGDDEGSGWIDKPTTGMNALVRCTSAESLSAMAAMENLTDERYEVVLGYENLLLTGVTFNGFYTFTDVEAANVARPVLEEQVNLIGSMDDNGVEYGVEQSENVLSYRAVVPADLLATANTGLTLNTEDGSIDTGMEAMKTSLELQGYVCAIEEQ